MYRYRPAGVVSHGLGFGGLRVLGHKAKAVAFPVAFSFLPGTFIKAYAAIVNGARLDLTPLDVQATSDGGWIALADTETSQGLGVDWLVKLSATGVPQWQEQVGCASPQGAPGDYADGVSVQQTADGGYVVAGGSPWG